MVTTADGVHCTGESHSLIHFHNSIHFVVSFHLTGCEKFSISLIDTLVSGRNTFVSWLSFKMRVFNLEKIWCMYIYYICEQRCQHTSTLTQVVVAHSGRCCNCSISDQSESWFSSRFSNRRPTGRETSPGRLQKKMGPNLVSTMYQNWLQPSLDDYSGDDHYRVITTNC